MLTPERAKHILANIKDGELIWAYERECCGSHAVTHPDGLTRSEYDHLKEVWRKMPGNRCQYDALNAIAFADL